MKNILISTLILPLFVSLLMAYAQPSAFAIKQTQALSHSKANEDTSNLPHLGQGQPVKNQPTLLPSKTVNASPQLINTKSNAPVIGKTSSTVAAPILKTENPMKSSSPTLNRGNQNASSPTEYVIYGPRKYQTTDDQSRRTKPLPPVGPPPPSPTTNTAYSGTGGLNEMGAAMKKQMEWDELYNSRKNVTQEKPGTGTKPSSGGGTNPPPPPATGPNTNMMVTPAPGTADLEAAKKKKMEEQQAKDKAKQEHKKEVKAQQKAFKDAFGIGMDSSKK